MAHRTILTERQRSVLFDLPIDETAMLRHYILADDDLRMRVGGAPLGRNVRRGRDFAKPSLAMPVMRGQ
ncbi:MAG: hypothetical protein DI498_14585 [Paracoccus denitrificans]|nr:MAG: hypothetical protein DI498_14585 [Paracoccus denitrificans]PZO82670.1 MAG: hypothetical protein DI633_14585 [Paracoccus denitrificans]